MRLRSLEPFLVCAILVGFTTGCGPISSITVGSRRDPAPRVATTRRPGPPPHAPAHGYRHKQEYAGGEVELEFDSGLGVYVVVGVPDRYYWDGYYLRIDGDQWYASVDLDGGWEPRSEVAVPTGLRTKSHRNAKKSGKPGKSSPAKGRW